MVKVKNVTWIDLTINEINPHAIVRKFEIFLKKSQNIRKENTSEKYSYFTETYFHNLAGKYSSFIFNIFFAIFRIFISKIKQIDIFEWKNIWVIKLLFVYYKSCVF